MKRKLLLQGILMLMLGCSSSEEDPIRSFMPGTYVRFSDHEMRKELDTITIDLISETGNNYSLTRSSSFQKKLDEKVFPWEHAKEEWTAYYDPHERVLHETRKGKMISFIPEQNMLLVGTTKYKKIK